MKPTMSMKAMGAGLLGLGVAVLADANVNEAHATCVPEPYIGSLCLTAGTYCPRDYVEANGGVLAISDNPTLYAVIGTSFGGNGVTTMGVPDLRGRSAIHYGTGIGLSPAYFGFSRGQETITPDLDYLATHSHAAVFTPNGGTGSPLVVTLEASTTTTPTQKTPTAGSYIAQAGVGIGAAASFDPAPTSMVELGGITISGGGSSGGTVTVGDEGSSDPIPTIPPQLTMRYCMAIDGLFPPRT